MSERPDNLDRIHAASERTAGVMRRGLDEVIMRQAKRVAALIDDLPDDREHAQVRNSLNRAAEWLRLAAGDAQHMRRSVPESRVGVVEDPTKWSSHPDYIDAIRKDKK